MTGTRRVQRGTFKRSCRTCGWTSTYDTTAKADYAKRRHSCAKHLAAAAAVQRHRERMAAIDRTPQPCLHKIADHQHGTRACYTLDRCRCLPCSRAVMQSERDRYRQKAYGRYDKYVDAAEARAHVRALMDAGMGLKRIVEVSDLAQGSLWKLMYGKRNADGSQAPSKRITRINHDRIMAVTVDLADGAFVDASGTRLRMRALVALGWSQSILAARLGVARCNFRLVDADRVTVKTEREARALYDHLSMKVPTPSRPRDRASVTRSRRDAARRGWLPPLALDDDLIDDPTYDPTIARDDTSEALDDLLIDRIVAGEYALVKEATRLERVSVVSRFRAAGLPLVALERAGIKPERYIEEDAA